MQRTTSFTGVKKKRSCFSCLFLKSRSNVLQFLSCSLKLNFAFCGTVLDTNFFFFSVFPHCLCLVNAGFSFVFVGVLYYSVLIWKNVAKKQSIKSYKTGVSDWTANLSVWLTDWQFECRDVSFCMLTNWFRREARLTHDEICCAVLKESWFILAFPQKARGSDSDGQITDSAIALCYLARNLRYRSLSQLEHYNIYSPEDALNTKSRNKCEHCQIAVPHEGEFLVTGQRVINLEAIRSCRNNPWLCAVYPSR
jgi:hypothetical protein